MTCYRGEVMVVPGAIDDASEVPLRTRMLTEEIVFLLSLPEWLAADFSIIATHSSRDREPSGLLRLIGGLWL